MKYKKGPLISLILSILGIVVGNMIWRWGIVNCVSDTCRTLSIEYFGKNLTLGLAFVLVSSLLLLFFSDKIFKSWKKFSCVYLLLAVLLVIFTPAQCGAPINLCFNKVRVTILAGIVFVIISLGIIIYQKIKEKRG